MATTVQVELQAKTDKAIQEIEGLQQEIKNLSKQVDQANKNTSEGLKDVKETSEQTAGGISKIGTAIKAAGIGLAVAAFAKLSEVFNENQKVADAFGTVFETLSLAFNDFFNFLNNNIGTITGFFSSIFDDPKQAIIDFGTAIKNNLIERFNSFLDTLGFVSSAVKKVFSGDFAGALEDVKSAGKESIDVLTGVNNSFDKSVETVTKVTSSIVDYTRSTIDAAKSNVQLTKQAEIARVRQQGLIESFDLQAEKLRQVRDEERNTIEDRIKANNDLAAVLDEQEKQMLEMVDLQILAAQKEFEKNQNQENTIALLEAQQEKEAVLAQIQGFRSEQLSNDLALNREKLELEQSISDAESERAISEAEFTAEQIEGEYLRLQALRDAALQEEEIETARLTKKRDLYNEGTQAFVDAQNELLLFQQENSQRQLEIERDLAKAKEETITQALGNLATIVGENTKFGKAIAVVQAIRDTLSGANKALSASPPPFNFIAAAAVAASGFANVKSILSTPDPTPPSFATGGTGGAARVASVPPAATAPAFNIVGASGINQLAEVVGQQTTQPVKAFVVSKDVTTSQELDRNIVKGASL
jgi:hypothetical protein